MGRERLLPQWGSGGESGDGQGGFKHHIIKVLLNRWVVNEQIAFSLKNNVTEGKGFGYFWRAVAS